MTRKTDIFKCSRCRCEFCFAWSDDQTVWCPNCGFRSRFVYIRATGASVKAFRRKLAEEGAKKESAPNPTFEKNVKESIRKLDQFIESQKP